MMGLSWPSTELHQVPGTLGLSPKLLPRRQPRPCHLHSCPWCPLPRRCRATLPSQGDVFFLCLLGTAGLKELSICVPAGLCALCVSPPPATGMAVVGGGRAARRSTASLRSTPTRQLRQPGTQDPKLLRLWTMSGLRQNWLPQRPWGQGPGPALGQPVPFLGLRVLVGN